MHTTPPTIDYTRFIPSLGLLVCVVALAYFLFVFDTTVPMYRGVDSPYVPRVYKEDLGNQKLAGIIASGFGSVVCGFFLARPVQHRSLVTTVSGVPQARKPWKADSAFIFNVTASSISFMIICLTLIYRDSLPKNVGIAAFAVFGLILIVSFTFVASKWHT